MRGIAMKNRICTRPSVLTAILVWSFAGHVVAAAAASAPAAIGTVTIYGTTSDVFRFTARQSVDLGTGGNQSGSVTFQPFSVVKAHDALTPTLFEDNARATHIPQVRIDLESSVDTTPVLTSYLLEDVVIAAHGTSRLRRRGPTYEAISFRVFGRVTLSVTSGGNTTETCWDLVTSASC
jgi:type VI protein secretion system component Hcp